METNALQNLPNFEGIDLNSLDQIFISFIKKELETYIADRSTDKTLLLFPATNSFRRLLIHHTVAIFPSLTTQSVGDGKERRVAVCKASTVRTPQGTVMSSPQTKDRVMTSVEVAGSRSKSKMRRPDQQVYVPRARRNLEAQKNATNKPRSSEPNLIVETRKDLKSPKVKCKAVPVSLQPAPPSQPVIPVVTCDVISDMPKPQCDIMSDIPRPQCEVVSDIPEPRYNSSDDVSDIVISEVTTTEDVMQEYTAPPPPPPPVVSPIVVDDCIVAPQPTVAPQPVVELPPSEGSWDTIYDENGDCVKPQIMTEIEESFGNVRVRYAGEVWPDWQWVEVEEDPLGHVLEVYSFSADLKTGDIVAALLTRQVSIVWVDDTHALAVFETTRNAIDALSNHSSVVKVRPLIYGSTESRAKAKRSLEQLQPLKKRPETSAALARRLVCGALGMRTAIDPKQRDREKMQLTKAKERKRMIAQQQEAAWEGTFDLSS